MRRDASGLGNFEQLVLLAVVRLDREAYGMAVRHEIDSRTGRTTSLGAVYSTLDRLERKGLLTSNTQKGDALRGGRARRFFALTPAGRTTLQGTLRATEKMLDGIAPDLLEPA